MKVKLKQSGVTLAEMLTAVAITVIMLGASGMIFKSASKTSGKAMALNDIMGQVRVATTQIEKDFTGFRGDLPWAIIFEGYNKDINGDGIPDNVFERRDRIFFFANGDFNTLDNIKADTARIFYGQSQDSYPNPETDGLTGIPKQRILCRAQKLMSSIATYLSPSNSIDPRTFNYNIASASPLNWFDYDLFQLEYGPDSFWSNVTRVNYLTWLSESYSVANNIFNTTNRVSFVRRPNFANIQAASMAAGKSSYYDDIKQSLYMLDDVTDFTVQIWWQPPGEPQSRWYPNDNDLQLFHNLNAASFGFSNSGNNIHYNKNIIGSNVYFGVGANLRSSIDSSAMSINGVVFSAALPPASMNFLTLNILPLDSLEIERGYERPTAMKISFVIRDNGRVHYPDGRRVEYVVKLPKPKN